MNYVISAKEGEAASLSKVGIIKSMVGIGAGCSM